MQDPNGKTVRRGNSSDQIARPLAAAICIVVGALCGCNSQPKVSEQLPEPTEGTEGEESVAQTESSLRFDSGRRLLGYYAQWAIYGGHGTYNPCMVPFTKYTHINYAFVGVRTTPNAQYNLGGVSATANPYTFTDPPVAPAVLRSTGNYDNHFKWLKGLDYHADEGHTNCNNQTFNDGHAVGPIAYGGKYGGNIGLFRRAKEVFPDLKFIISFGGWTKGAGFPIVAADATKRGEFCDDAIRIMRRFSADGIDLDWEFPGEARAPDPGDSNDEGVPGGGPADKANFTALLSACRSKLNAAGSADGKTYDLTIAQSAGKKHIDDVDWAAIISNGSLSHVNLMSYDLHGAFDPKTGHQSGLYANPQDSFAPPINTQFNVDWAFRYLTGSGGAPPEGTKSFPSNKVSIGMAFYTRGWNNVSGGIDVDGGGPDGLFGSGGSSLPGNWGPGGQNGLNKIYELKAQGGWKEIWDNSAKAHFLYSSSQAALYTYDTVKSVEEKTNYCKSRNCGGMFNWEIDGDTNVGGQSYPLISRVADLLAEGGCTPNRNCPTNSCGNLSDGCGGTLNCGSCSGGAICSGNQCVTACQTAQCGTSCGTIDDGCGGTRDCGGCPTGQMCNASHQCVAVVTQTPYQTVNVNATPVTIQAENYDNGGEGVAYHDATSGNSKGQHRSDGVDIEATTDIDLGYNVASTEAGEWLEYTVNVQTAGTYNFDFRFANNNTGNQTVKAYIDNTQIGSNLTVGNTGGWQTWQTFQIPNVNLSTTGSKVLKVEFTTGAPTGALNFNWIKVSKSGDSTAPTAPASPITSGATSSQITLSWTASTDNVAVTGYRVYRNGMQVGTVTSGTSYTYTGLQPQSTYSLGVSAFDAAGNNSGTATAALASTTGTCSGVRVYQNSAYGGYGVCLQTGDYNTAALTARGIKDNDATSLKVLTGYGMTLYELDNYGGASLVKGVGDDSTLTDDPLGAGSWNDKPSSIKVYTAGADTTAPSIPTALSTSAITTTQITLSWTASSDNVGVTGYEVYRDGTKVTTVTGTTYTFTGLTASTTYTLGVKARDGSNNVSALATKGATTGATSGGNCGAAAWSSSTSYSSGSIVKEVCAWNILCTASDLNKTFAWRCDGNPASFCAAYEPGAVNSNWSGIWTKLEQCP